MKTICILGLIFGIILEIVCIIKTWKAIKNEF